MGTGADGVSVVRRFGAWGWGVTDSKVTADLSALDDLALVRSFVDGERTAFDTIVARHQRAVYQVCYRFVHNHEDAADLTQDVFVRAFKGLKAFRGDAKLSTWLHRVAVNVCLNRTALVRPGIEPLDPARHVDDRSEDAFGMVARGERAADVRRAIAQLPPKQRATVMLRVYQELSHEAIAEILGGTVGAAKANFFHALGNLKRMLES
ncbi:MAG: RNA polymerase sigma factor [Acidimicrobiia bacterium]|nr:RNA polymerase sigma factor [Acidimicrobiia bacterium]